MILALVTGVLAGIAIGYVLQRGQLCFHSAIARGLDGRGLLARGWALGVAIGATGLAVLYLLPGTDGLNEGLAFRPVANVVGGLVIGVGMVVAMSCVSGLFYKLGSGMLGAGVGIAGWAAGELLARQVTLPGPTTLGGGVDGTVPGVLGVPRLLAAVVLLVAVVVWLLRRPGADRPWETWQWGWRVTGPALGVALVAGWALAALGDSGFGPSSVGAVDSVADGTPNHWLIAFLVGIVAGGFLAARSAGGLWVRGEQPVRYVQLAVGGALLGAGGWIAGGCNLGHGLSGVAQLNVSSFVVVAAMVAGVAVTRAVLRRSGTSPVSPVRPSSG
ncbi:YeeE/YedE thiosulfate transporter family protein [Aeromicrobium marinum]|uniref:YeeE/YedE thiosulfate transporter family protein n=1 Tax=Aeromicrobium marinum TaxID=219314 RepID=UPI00058D2409|nr:YeeE/YedE thiosulfate transporter family protein [Aeromicrobium marinum]